jgi:2-haloacid dehalogenase
MTIRAVVFDAYGTLYDVQSVRRRAMELCGEEGDLLTRLWRCKQLEYTWLRALMGRYEDFAAVTRAALDYCLEALGIPATPALCAALMAEYDALDLHPEAMAALDGLARLPLAILSNGSPAMLAALVGSSGLAGRFAEVISVDRARTYKPDPAAYALVEPALGVAPGEVLFVSSNGFDVAGAKAFGFRVAWIRRGGGGEDFFSLLRGRGETLGVAADWELGALTDLVSLR